MGHTCMKNINVTTIQLCFSARHDCMVVGFTTIMYNQCLSPLNL